ncbi:MAG: peptide-methionine (S)-S-oxide reductase, partial [Candidatus Omnitrophica bacterium]|nr:peptide-methionine (S)-S-oxide reductase [Candidatus Omnitrophota bacterium]
MKKIACLSLLIIFFLLNNLSAEQKGRPAMLQEATFAAGCFWGVESAFREVKGVVSVRSGYTGGHFKNP